MSTCASTSASSGITINGALAASLTAAALACVTVISSGAGVIDSVSRGAIGDQLCKSRIDELVSKHGDGIAEYRGRFDGRGVFFPPRVHRKFIAPTQTPIEASPNKPTNVDLPPVQYVGPPVIWAVGDEVYFGKHVPTKSEKYIKLRVGDEVDGVTLLDISDLPNTIRVRHRGGEYDLNLFGSKADASTLFHSDPFEPTLDGITPQVESEGESQ